MTSLTNRYLTDLILFVLLIAGSTIACARFGSLGVTNKHSDKVNQFNYEIPSGFEGAVLDPNVGSGFVIVMPDSNQLMLQSIDSPPIDLPTLREKVKAFAAGKPESDRTVYIAALPQVGWDKITDVLIELRNQDIQTVKFLTSSYERRTSTYAGEGFDKSLGDIPPPDRVFEVNIGDDLAAGFTLYPKPQAHNVETIISGGILNGKAISLPRPDYPPAARAARLSGSVNVQVTVDTHGNVVSANAENGHPLLRASATLAARSAKFAPTLVGGQPSKVTGILVYNFSP